ncbi:hypothetical protein [Lysobacter sp. CA199]|uniref:hypothetical protein n=1 Tax=Lysobacter sp. CA199 TaxID=3455608 RepID=UPI003F8D315C
MSGKRFRLKTGDVFSIKLREDLFTLAQVRENHLIQFFDIAGEDARWNGVDLNAADALFCIYVADQRIRSLIDAIVPAERVAPSARPTPRLMLSAFPIMDQKYKCSVDLIELSESYDSVDAAVLKADLTPDTDADTLLRHELAGMWGDPIKLGERLIRFFETRIDWDPSKTFIFGDDLKPTTR